MLSLNKMTRKNKQFFIKLDLLWVFVWPNCFITVFNSCIIWEKVHVRKQWKTCRVFAPIFSSYFKTLESSNMLDVWRNIEDSRKSRNSVTKSPNIFIQNMKLVFWCVLRLGWKDTGRSTGNVLSRWKLCPGAKRVEALFHRFQAHVNENWDNVPQFSCKQKKIEA